MNPSQAFALFSVLCVLLLIYGRLLAILQEMRKANNLAELSFREMRGVTRGRPMLVKEVA